MNKTNISTLTLIILSMTLIGCEKPEPKLPEVNNENCTMEKIKKLDKRIMKEFGTKCSTRRIYKPVKPESW